MRKAYLVLDLTCGTVCHVQKVQILCLRVPGAAFDYIALDIASPKGAVMCGGGLSGC